MLCATNWLKVGTIWRFKSSLTVWAGLLVTLHLILVQDLHQDIHLSLVEVLFLSYPPEKAFFQSMKFVGCRVRGQREVCWEDSHMSNKHISTIGWTGQAAN